MFARMGLIIMLMLATWMPFQSVAAWRMMDESSFSGSTQITPSVVKAGITSLMKSSCHMQTDAKQKTMTMNHDSVQCSSCLPLCSGVPPISLSLKEFSRQPALDLAFSFPLYNDHVPAVISPPPVAFIL